MSSDSGSRKTPNPGWFSKGRCGNPGGRPKASPAASAQNAFGSSTLRRYIASYCSRLLMCASAANSAGGGNTRFSRSKESMFVLSNVCTHIPPCRKCRQSGWQKADSQKKGTLSPV